MSPAFPRARQVGLVREDVGGEIVVLDTVTQTAHCLSACASRVWLACDGERDRPAVVAFTGEPPEVVQRALDELDALELLAPAPRPQISRRDALRRMATTGVAAATTPLIYSAVLNPAPAHASTGPQCRSCASSSCPSGYGCDAGHQVCIATGCRFEACTVGSSCLLGTFTGTCSSCASTTLCCPS